jgi:hypothetical protein
MNRKFQVGVEQQGAAKPEVVIEVQSFTFASNALGKGPTWNRLIAMSYGEADALRQSLATALREFDKQYPKNELGMRTLSFGD